MIDPHRTGAVIARLRRDRDWTQLELAERLHVTHQAVSRWERGESFPDLVVLHNLAELFGVGVDALLDRPSGTDSTDRPRAAPGAVLDELAQDRPERVVQMIREGQADVESVAEAAPAVRPSQMERVIQGLSDFAFSVEQVVSLAPFVSTALLQDLVERLEGAGVPLEGAHLADLAPFLGRDYLERLVPRAVTGDPPAALLEDLAPFLEKPTVDALAARLPSDPAHLAHLAALAPFTSREVLDGLVEAFGDRVPVHHAVALAPFVSRAVLDRLVGRLDDGDLDADSLVDFAPFLPRETLRRLVEERLERLRQPNVIAELAPFLDRGTLESLIRGGSGGSPGG